MLKEERLVPNCCSLFLCLDRARRLSQWLFFTALYYLKASVDVTIHLFFVSYPLQVRRVQSCLWQRYKVWPCNARIQDWKHSYVSAPDCQVREEKMLHGVLGKDVFPFLMFGVFQLAATWTCIWCVPTHQDYNTRLACKSRCSDTSIIVGWTGFAHSTLLHWKKVFSSKRTRWKFPTAFSIGTYFCVPPMV